MGRKPMTKSDRVFVLGIIYTLLAWLLVFISPHLLLSVFTDDTAMIEAGVGVGVGVGVGALRLYFFVFFFMAFQFTGQSTFTVLGYSRHAIFFSLLRKAISEKSINMYYFTDIYFFLLYNVFNTRIEEMIGDGTGHKEESNFIFNWYAFGL